MRKIRFVMEEFFRSFHKSIFKNILLMLMFSISLVMGVLMCSYYLDMGDRYKETTQHIGDSTWYSINYVMADYESNHVVDSFTTVTGCRNMMNFYEELSSSQEYPFFSLNDAQSVVMRDADLKSAFGEKSYLNFLDEPEPAYTFYTEDEQCLMWWLKGAQIDLGAYRMFGLRTVEGEGFTEENMEIQKASDTIPILLGNDYRGVIEVGATMDINCWGYVYPCRVIGILERGSAFPPFGKMNVEMTSMDSRIILPHGIRVKEDTENVGEMERYAFNDYIAVEDGIVCLPDGGELIDMIAAYREVGERYDLPPAQIAGTSVGMDLFRKESSASVRNLLILTIALTGFAFYGLFVTFYDKIQSNRRIYGIYLMNGCSLSMILIPCFIEVAVILVPAVFLGRYALLSADNMGSFPVEITVRVVYFFVGIAFLAGAGFITYLMRGVDTEHLMRQKD